MRAETPLPLALLLLAFAARSQDPLQTRLEGVVVDPLHEPVQNAEVVVELDGVAVATTRSDGSGAFLFPKVPAQFVVVRATTDAPDIGAESIDLWGERRGFVTVRTGPARRVGGVVRDDAGNPVPGAWVLASPTPWQRTSSHCTAQADGEGRYELTHVAMGSVNLRAWCDRADTGTFEGRLMDSSDETLDCELPRDEDDWQSYRLDGATPERVALAELRMLAFSAGSPVPLPPALARPRAGEPGRWELRGWARADATAAFVVLDGAIMWPPAHWVEGGLGASTRRFVLGDPECRVTGRLTDAAGKPVAGCALLLQPFGEFVIVNAYRRVAVTAADGSFTVQSPVVAGHKLAIRSMSAGTVLAGNDSNPVWFVGDQEVGKEWRLWAAPADAVRLDVTRDDGTPAPGTYVAVSVRDDHGRERQLGVGVSRLDGSVDIDCLTLPTPVELRLAMNGPEGDGVFDTKIARRGDIRLGKFRLEPPSELRGRVVDAAGAPVAGAPIVIQRVWPPVFQQPIHGVACDRDGNFVIRGLKGGDYTFVLAGPKQPPVFQYHVDAGATTEVELTLR
ncbi:MAG: carboxypeptidase regulatory-like domain-containing protein [Planctomycetes bacterium]|nr:carboxypeptidase regulatory-like domain-containing protein [Planctomycetota bacterium]